MKTAVLGATGLVGRYMLRLLEQREWCDEPPLLLTSERSAGRLLPFRRQQIACQDAATCDWTGIELALFSGGAQASRRLAPLAARAGCLVIDNSSAFRLDPDVPLVVPEINGELSARLDAARSDRGGIIANPNCSTIQIALALAPLQHAFGLREVHVTTMQAVSGAGRRAVHELARQLHAQPCREAAAENAPDAADAIVTGWNRSTTSAAPAVFPRPIASNVVPEIGQALADGSFQEEDKVVRELIKILENDALEVTCIATRVPVWNGHSAAIRTVLSQPVQRDDAIAAMVAWPGLVVAGSPHEYPTAWSVSGDPRVHVGRLRVDPNREDALLLWVVADNLLKGAAANALQIADHAVGERRDHNAGE